MADPEISNTLSTPVVRRRRTLIELLQLTILALVIVTPIRFFVAQPFVVSGASMYPTFKAGDYLVIDRLSYDFEKPMRGDVIIFHYPLDPSFFYIKRIIGLPGETVSIDRSAISVRTGNTSITYPLTEPYLSSGHKDYRPVSITLAKDEYFVLGDNRDASSDSREWGPLQSKFIVGRVFVRVWPGAMAGLFPGKYVFPQAE